MVETGLPGRPSTRARSLAANISGLPGRMAMRQKSMAKPCALSARLHEIVVADRGAARGDQQIVLRAGGDAVLDQRARRRGAMSNRVGSPPQPRTSAATAMPEERRSGCGRPARPASPARRRSRGSRSAAADAPRARAGSSRAASADVARRQQAAGRAAGLSPAVKSSPAWRTWRPMRGASRMVIVVAVGLGVFLDDDRVGAQRQRRRR